MEKRPVPWITVRNGIIVTDPDYPSNDHYCVVLIIRIMIDFFKFQCVCVVCVAFRIKNT